MVVASRAYKKNGKLIVECEDKKNFITYNLNTKVLTSYTNKEVCRMPNVTFGYNLSQAEKLIIMALRKESYRHFYAKALDIFLSYADMLENVYDIDDLPNACPRGYINWLKENGLSISKKTLDQFSAMQETKNFSKAEKEIYDFLAKYVKEDNLKFFRNKLTKEERLIFGKILKNSTKTFNWNFSHDYEKFFEIIYHKGYTIYNYDGNDNQLSIPKNVLNIMDINRDINYNRKLIVTNYLKSHEALIIGNENKIRAIESLSNDTYTVVVPKSLNDFTIEGNQQNNCVGYYYHNNIINMRDLIYFIRKTEKPKKSYITNRYNIDYKKTVESLATNNRYYDDEGATELIEKIDQMITKLLKGD